MTRRRRFKDKGLQAAYDHYRGNPVDPVSQKGRGSAGNAYYVGRTIHRLDRPFSVRGSLAYACWAAGIDNARDAGELP